MDVMLVIECNASYYHVDQPCHFYGFIQCLNLDVSYEEGHEHGCNLQQALVAKEIASQMMDSFVTQTNMMPLSYRTEEDVLEVQQPCIVVHVRSFIITVHPHID